MYGLSAVWKSNIYLLGILTTAIVAGKAMGGYLADKFGFFKTSFFALIISAPLITFFSNNPLFSITGLMIFQITMPIIVTTIHNLLPGKPATAFGLTVSSLLIGIIPTYFKFSAFLKNSYISFVLIILTASLIFFAFQISKNYLLSRKVKV